MSDIGLAADHRRPRRGPAGHPADRRARSPQGRPRRAPASRHRRLDVRRAIDPGRERLGLGGSDVRSEARRLDPRFGARTLRRRRRGSGSRRRARGRLLEKAVGRRPAAAAGSSPLDREANVRGGLEIAAAFPRRGPEPSTGAPGPLSRRPLSEARAGRRPSSSSSRGATATRTRRWPTSSCPKRRRSRRRGRSSTSKAGSRSPARPSSPLGEARPGWWIVAGPGRPGSARRASATSRRRTSARAGRRRPRLRDAAGSAAVRRRPASWPRSRPDAGASPRRDPAAAGPPAAAPSARGTPTITRV